MNEEIFISFIKKINPHRNQFCDKVYGIIGSQDEATRKILLVDTLIKVIIETWAAKNFNEETTMVPIFNFMGGMLIALTEGAVIDGTPGHAKMAILDDFLNYLRKEAEEIFNNT